MNQDGDPTNGETNGNDTFATSLVISPTPQGFPYVEGFESGSFDTLGGWSFSIKGDADWSVGPSFGDSFGGFALRSGQVVTGLVEREAYFAVDVAGQPDIYLDFWLQSYGDNGTETRLLISDDAKEWIWLDTIVATDGEPSYFAYDLAARLISANIEADEDIYVKFSQRSLSSSANFALDNVRVSDIDPFGPRIVAQSSVEAENEISRFTVTFDEVVDPASFTPEDVLITLPGTVLPVTSVETLDGLTFTITLPEMRLAGLYDVAIGPDILGVDGIPMNQDQDSQNGEVVEDVYYSGLFIAAQPVTLPHFQGFESGDLGAVEGWTFQAEGEFSWGGGDWRVIQTQDPYEGEYHLQATQHADCWSTHDAILAIDTTDLTNGVDLVLDFYMQRLSGRNKSAGGRNMGKLFVSNDGASWTQVGDESQLIDTSVDLLSDLDKDGTFDLVPPLGEYVNYKFDFDAMLSAAGVELGGTIYLDVHRLAFYADDVTTWDNISIYSEGGEPVAADISRRNLVLNDTPGFGDQIAMDSAPTFPGEGLDSSAVSNYSRGINGIVVDIAADVLPADGADVNVGDFRFRVANLDDPGSWSIAPSPPSITVTSSGVVDQIRITWPDDSIRYERLQVTLLAGEDTGLSVDDVFYFVSLPGDADRNGVIDHQDYDIWSVEKFTVADSTTRSDFNRDGFVDGTDFNVLVARSNGAVGRNAGIRVARPARSPAAHAAVDQANLAFAADDDTRSTHRDVSSDAIRSEAISLRYAQPWEPDQRIARRMSRLPFSSSIDRRRIDLPSEEHRDSEWEKIVEEFWADDQL